MSNITRSEAECCDHNVLIFTSTSHAGEVGYKRPDINKRTTAASLNTKSAPIVALDDALFPAPLVLPHDDLSIDPKYPTQSVRSWHQEKDRNPVTSERRTIYVAAPPSVGRDVQFIQRWVKPRSISSKDASIAKPNIEDIVDYLKAFYHGLPVKFLPPKLKFSCWDKNSPQTNASYSKGGYIGLEMLSGRIGIRTRTVSDGDFVQQLNLDDLLDAAIEVLPEDAYALLLLVDHDLYEDEEDLFVCGRAYGASRIAVISTARYHPALDEMQDVPREHAWPASHCQKYLDECYSTSRSKARPKKENVQNSSQPATLTTGELSQSPLRAAVEAYKALPSLNLSFPASTLSGLWLSRCCRTASHELGHCFGIDHCVYYACAMQGSASIIEDARQPPYLCPIDLVKVLKSTGSSNVERYQALLRFCDKHKDTHLFAAFGAWIRAILATLSHNTVIDLTED
ncbi:hypothetical protein F5884DRAFT_671082 [Xylogone sp. PMI_703]|nr:hypothetical protein F5884DRAFT_671082 [Xylogone sp. PMI_703]